MQEHQTIFSKKELKSNVKNAFPTGIPNKEQKLKIIENWQQNISSGKYLNAKEEEIKPLFLTQFFGEILGYDYNNSTYWNLLFENKTSIDSKKSDAALGFFKIRHNDEILKDVRAVIEIKDARTTLDKPQNRKDFKGSAVEQAFMYAAKTGEKCKWVIVSNFLEIRLYLANDMTKYESFDIMSLTDNYEFSRFYFLLSFGQLFYENLSSTIDNFLEKRLEKEKNITNEFYSEFQSLRELFFYHLKTHNPKIEPLKLLQFAQTIMDRILFVSVIKDYDLINSDVLRRIEKLADESWADDNLELWRQLKKFFKALDNGLPPRIHKFNGGLFRTNQELDNLVIKDIFLKRLFILNKYDFESDLNVNVLGHIFEQSITDIELLKKDIIGNKQIEYSETVDEIDLKYSKSETNKRKKEGIFYTPENITRFIVKSTIGNWLEERKNELGINSFTEFPKNEKEKKEQLQLWEIYQTILQKLKILDPTCGSGAFLTQAFDYLLYEWQMTIDIIDKLKVSSEKLKVRHKIGLFVNEIDETKKQISQIKKDIVNNNLFGVDLNHESVEITKLGLWLKSASKNDPLALLDNNIKCGNSLISDKSVTEKAFVWETEFQEIMNNGGFDIIVGNPPYVSTKVINENEKKYFIENYKTAIGQFDLYGLFFEKSIRLLHEKSKFGFITSNTYLSNKDFLELRKYLFQNVTIHEIINLGETVFTDANLDVAIIIFSVGLNENNKIKITINNDDFKNDKFHYISQNKFSSDRNNYEIKLNSKEEDFKLIDKIFDNKIELSTILDLPRGIEIGSNSDKISIENRFGFHKLLVGKDISKYAIHFANRYIKFENDKSVFKDLVIYEQTKILIQRIRNLSLKTRIVATIDTDNYLCTNTLRIGIIKNSDFDLYFILAILNSDLINWIFSKYFSNKDIYAYQLDRLPIKPIKKTDQKIFVDYAKKIIENNKTLNDKITKFKSNLTTNFDKLKITPSLIEFYKLDFKEFVEELSKQKITINQKKQDEWFDYFNLHKQSISD